MTTLDVSSSYMMRLLEYRDAARDVNWWTTHLLANFQSFAPTLERLADGARDILENGATLRYRMRKREGNDGAQLLLSASCRRGAHDRPSTSRILLEMTEHALMFRHKPVVWLRGHRKSEVLFLKAIEDFAADVFTGNKQ